MNALALDMRRHSSDHATERHIETGDEIGERWIVGEPLGSGGHATVYQAEHRELGHSVAIKVLHLDRLGNALEEMVQRFRREARIAAGMRHRNVVRVYDSGELVDGSPYFVMELIDGEDLQARIDRDGPLSVAAAVDVALQALTGLDALAHTGVIHRDVKPGNLMLRARARGGYTIKLVDFGIASVECCATDRMTVEGTVLGTPEYMSPEQIRGLELDPRADVYSLGVVLYEVLAGRLPFAGKGPCATLAMALTQDPPALRALRPGIPEAIEAIVMRALEKDRELRWPSSLAMANALRAAAHELGLPRGDAAWQVSDDCEVIEDVVILESAGSGALAGEIIASEHVRSVDDTGETRDRESSPPRRRPAARAHRSAAPPLPPAVPRSAIIEAFPEEQSSEGLFDGAIAPVLARVVAALVTLGLATVIALRLTEPTEVPQIARDATPHGEVQSWAVPAPFTIPEPEQRR